MPGCRILLIDDDPQTASFVEKTMAAHDCHVAFFPGVYDAIDELTLNRADLVLVSADIPEGLAACTRIKADPELRGIPVVAMSMDIDRPDLEEHRTHAHHRADLYLARPIESSALAEQLSGLLGAGPAPKPAVDSEPEPLAEEDLDGAEFVDVDAIEFTDEAELKPPPFEPSSETHVPLAPPTEAVMSDLDAGMNEPATDPEILRQNVSASGFETVQAQSHRAQAERDDATQALEGLRQERDETDAELAELRGQLEGLEHRAGRAEEQLTETVVGLAQAQEERDEAQQKLTRAARERDALIRELDRVRETSNQAEENEGAQDELSEELNQELNEELSEEIARARTARDEAEAALNDARKERDDAVSLRDEQGARNETLTEEISAAKQEREHAEEELARAREERDDSAQKLGQAQRERDAVVEELVRSRRKREDNDAELEELRATFETLEREHGETSAELETLRGQEGALERVEELEGQLETLRSERDELAARAEAAETKNASLSEQVEELSQRAEVTTGELEKLQGAAARERGRAQALLGALSDRHELEGAEDAAAELTRLASELADAHGAIEEVDDIRTQAKAEREEIESARDAALAERAAVQEELEALRAEMEEVRAGEEQLREDLEQVEAIAPPVAIAPPAPVDDEDDDRLKDLKASLSESQDRVEELERLLDALQNQADTAGQAEPDEIEVDFSEPDGMEVTSELRSWIERARVVTRRTIEALRKARAGLDSQQQAMQKDIEAWQGMEREFGVAVQALLRGGTSGSPTQFNQPLEQLQTLLSNGSTILQRRCSVDDSVLRLLDQVSAAWKQTDEQGSNL